MHYIPMMLCTKQGEHESKKQGVEVGVASYHHPQWPMHSELCNGRGPTL